MFIERLKKRVHALRREQKGATAVEFALVASVFFLIMLGILELGIMLILSNGLDDATADLARMVRTGQIYKQGFNQEQAKRYICGQLPFGGSCRDKLLLDIRTYPDFASMRPPTPPRRDSSGNVRFPENFQPGNPKQVVLVRAFYRWKFFTPMVGKVMSNFGNNEFLLSSVAVFRNEPYTR